MGQWNRGLVDNIDLRTPGRGTPNIASPQPGRGLSRPLIELIEMPSDEQLLTVARILCLEQTVQARLDREAAERGAS